MCSDMLAQTESWNAVHVDNRARGCWHVVTHTEPQTSRFHSLWLCAHFPSWLDLKLQFEPMMQQVVFSNVTLSKSLETERWWLPTKPPEKADALLSALCRRKCPNQPNQRQHVRTRVQEAIREDPARARPVNSDSTKVGTFHPEPHVALSLSSETILFLWELVLWTEWQRDGNNGGSQSVTFSIII